MPPDGGEVGRLVGVSNASTTLVGPGAATKTRGRHPGDGSEAPATTDIAHVRRSRKPAWVTRVNGAYAAAENRYVKTGSHRDGEVR